MNGFYKRESQYKLLISNVLVSSLNINTRHLLNENDRLG